MNITVVIINSATYGLPGVIVGGLIMWLKTERAINKLKESRRSLKKSEKDLEKSERDLERSTIELQKVKLEIQIKKDIEKFIPQVVRYYDRKRNEVSTQLQIYRSELDDLLRSEKMDVRDGVWKFLTESYDGICFRNQWESFSEGYYLLPQTKY
jgi:chromosome segregation ATPase